MAYLAGKYPSGARRASLCQLRRFVDRAVVVIFGDSRQQNPVGSAECVRCDRHRPVRAIEPPTQATEA